MPEQEVPIRLPVGSARCEQPIGQGALAHVVQESAAADRLELGAFQAVRSPEPDDVLVDA